MSSTEARSQPTREGRRAEVALELLLLGALLVIFGFYLHSAATRDQIDFGVYRAGGRAILDGKDLYKMRVRPIGLPFTYPPASAVSFGLLALLPVRAGQVVWMAVSLLGLCVFVRLVLTRYATGLVATSTVALLAILIVVVRSDPVRVNLLLGQINVLIALLIVADLCGVLPRVPRGVMIGIAAALKLTPLFLVAYFVAVRRYRDAAVAAATFVGVTLITFLFAPKASREYWFRAYFADARRAGGLSYISNQSLNGFIARVTGRANGSPGLWLIAAIVVAVTVLWAVRRIHDRRPWLAETIAFAAMLLLSPISWIHHWILVLPFLVACLRLGVEDRHRRGLFAGACVLSGLLWFGVIWHVPNTHNRELHHTLWQFFVGNVDVMLLVALLGAVILLTTRRELLDQH